MWISWGKYFVDNKPDSDNGEPASILKIQGIRKNKYSNVLRFYKLMPGRQLRCAKKCG